MKMSRPKNWVVPSTHSTKWRDALTSANEAECITQIKQLFSYIPKTAKILHPGCPIRPATKARGLNTIIPANPNQPYDMREVIQGVVDDGTFFEVHRNFLRKIVVVGLARIAGKVLG